MIEHFILFDKSKLFELIWEEKRSQFCNKSNATEVTFHIIQEQVWNPAIESCKKLLYKLYDKSFTYSDIKCLGNVGDINHHVVALYNIMHQCYTNSVSSLPESTEWVQQTVKSVKLYLDFASSTKKVNGAMLCLKLKDLLRLKGDFSVVENLVIQVSIL